MKNAWKGLVIGALTGMVGGWFGTKPKFPNELLRYARPLQDISDEEWERMSAELQFLKPDKLIIGGVRRARPTMPAIGQCSICGEERSRHFHGNYDHGFTPGWPCHYSYAPAIVRYEPIVDADVERTRADFEAAFQGPGKQIMVVFPPPTVEIQPITDLP